MTAAGCAGSFVVPVGTVDESGRVRDGAPRVLVIGDVAVDVLVSPEAEPVVGADVPARIGTVAGGAAANTAAWLARLGAAVTLVARVGTDAAADLAATELRAAGVAPRLRVDPDAATATVVVLRAAPGRTHERTLFSDRGAAAHLSPADLPPAADLSRFDHLHLSGYVLLGPGSRPAGLAALAAARAAGLTTSVDPQAAPGLTAEFLALVRGVDLLLPNADELAALGGAGPVGAAALLDAVGAVAATHGADGASWTDRSGHWRVPASPVDVRDVTGAGDAFDAGLLVAHLRGADHAAALTAGCAAAAAAVAVLGARPPRPAAPGGPG